MQLVETGLVARRRAATRKPSPHLDRGREVAQPLGLRVEDHAGRPGRASTTARPSIDQRRRTGLHDVGDQRAEQRGGSPRRRATAVSTSRSGSTLTSGGCVQLSSFSTGSTGKVRPATPTVARSAQLVGLVRLTT